MEQEILIREYINLVGRHAKLNPHRLWWATHFSSKNRFTSNILSRILKEVNGNYAPRVPWGWGIYSFIFKCLRFIKQCAFLSFRWFIVRCKLGADWKKGLSSEGAYYVIKSFVYDRSFTEKGYKDAFFGPVVEELSSRRKIIIFVNILGSLNFCLDQIRKEKSHYIVPLDLHISLFEILCECWRACFYKIKTEKPCLFAGNDVGEIIEDEISRSLNEVDPYQALHYQATRKLAKDFKITEFLLTFENNPWERMSIMALREVSPSTKIIGYQHAVIPQSALNMFVSQEEIGQLPIPDRILTVGQEPKRIMDEYGCLPQETVQISCGLRFEYLFKLPQFERKTERVILLALEGIVEVYQMVNFVIGQLKNSDFKILIRPHPVLPVKAFKPMLDFDLDKMANVEISSSLSVKDDIEKSCVVIYWGTTVALEALWMGRPVMHFDMNLGLNYDPLFRCSHLKFNMDTKKSLIVQLERILGMDQNKFIKERDSAREYLQQYFYPISKENLSVFEG